MVKSITALLIIKKGNVKKCFILDDRCFITQIASDLLLSHQNPDEAHGNLITAVVSKLDTVSFQGNSYLITEKARFLYRLSVFFENAKFGVCFVGIVDNLSFFISLNCCNISSDMYVTT